MFDDQMRDCMELFLGEYTGVIFKNYSIEYQRLSAYTFYPSMSIIELRRLAIENVTTDKVKQEIHEKIYQQLQIIFQRRMNNWNTVFHTTAKRFLTNSIDDTIESIRNKIIENSNTNVIIQRFELINNRLKLV